MGRPPQDKQDSSGRNTLIGLSFMLWTVAIGCSTDDGREAVDVYAASSLADIMNLVEEGYENDNPEVDIRMNLAGTNALVRQINSGANASIVVAADTSFLDDLVEPPAAPPVPLAINELTLVVPDDNPAGIVSPTDLDLDGVLTARCATGVPCGDATDDYLADNGLTIARATDEANVRSVLAKVSTGEVDAGFVYQTDAAATDTVINLPLDDAPQVTVTMARLSDDNAAIVLADYLGSDEVAAMFNQLGFGPPGGVGHGDDG